MMKSASSLLNGLNESQQLAVLHNTGPLLVLAGAGSGKTRVLTLRIARLVKEKHCKPEEILAVTFTNKAAAEMKERVAALVGSAAANAMTLATFHSFGARVLRESGEAIGLKRHFSILDENERLSTIRTLTRSAGTASAKEDTASIASQISAFKNASRTPTEVSRDDEVTRRTGKVYKSYSESLIKRQSVDFDDLLLLPLRIFENNAAITAGYQNRYRFICIDEYQDTNRVQMKIASLLAAVHGNLMVVGDDDQSIYSWRGADSRSIIDFAGKFSGCKTIILNQNYRSTRQILDAAYAVVERNAIRTKKQITAANGDGEPIFHFRGDDETEEAEWVAKTIADRIRPGAGNTTVSGESHALLFRTNAMMGRFETALREQKVAYRIVGGMSFFDRKEIRDLLAYMRFLANPADELSMMRVIKVPDRGIGKSAIEKLEELAGLRAIGLFEAFERHTVMERLNAAQHQSVENFVQWYARSKALIEKGPMAAALHTILQELDYREHLRRSCEADNADPTDRLAHIEEIIHALDTYETKNKRREPTLAGFVQELALDQQDATDRSAEADARAPVALMTIHKSKGLEFPSVYLCGLDDSVFPSPRAIEEGGIEEERRLFYVAMTRARKRLTLTYTRTKVAWGKTREVAPCRFLFEIPVEHLERPFGDQEDENLDEYRKNFFKEMQEKLAAAAAKSTVN